MSNRAVRRSPEEQLNLILECRSSGMSDQQWCMAHDINPGTFYNWVKRLRQKGDYEIPSPANRNTFAPEPKQDVVRMQILSEDENFSSIIERNPSCDSNPVISPAPIQIMTNGIQIHLTNDVDPHLLAQILHSLGGF